MTVLYREGVECRVEISEVVRLTPRTGPPRTGSLSGMDLTVLYMNLTVLYVNLTV